MIQDDEMEGSKFVRGLRANTHKIREEKRRGIQYVRATRMWETGRAVKS